MEEDYLDFPTTIPPRDDKVALERALLAAQIAADNRGKDITIMDLQKLTTAFDFFVVVTGTSKRQLHAIAEAIDHTFEKTLKTQRISQEGYRESRWILLDYGDVVIHMFDQETREYFRLEDLWGGAKIVEFKPVENTLE